MLEDRYHPNARRGGVRYTSVTPSGCATPSPARLAAARSETPPGSAVDRGTPDSTAAAASPGGRALRSPSAATPTGHPGHRRSLPIGVATAPAPRAAAPPPVRATVAAAGRGS